MLLEWAIDENYLRIGRKAIQWLSEKNMMRMNSISFEKWNKIYHGCQMWKGSLSRILPQWQQWKTCINGAQSWEEKPPGKIVKNKIHFVPAQLANLLTSKNMKNKC